MLKTINIPELKPVGAYSTVVQVLFTGDAQLSTDMYFVSGLLGMDYATGQIPETFEAQTQKIMENLKIILNRLDLDFGDIAKATVYVTDMNNFGKFNEVYGAFFNDGRYPAREVVEVRRLPKDAAVEVSFILVKPIDKKLKKLAGKVKEEVREGLDEISKLFQQLADKLK